MQKLLKVISVLTLLLFLRTDFALAADQVYFYYTDPAGTPLVMCNASGNVVWRADYLPFGEETIDQSTVQNSKMFAGREKDSESGLYYFGARYMDDGVGRFASPDPMATVNPATGNINLKILSNPQRLNVYTYGLNNPHRYVDPDGNTPWDILDIAFFAHSVATFINSPTSDNGINLALDTVGLLPIIPALGTIKRVGEGAINSSKIISRADDAAEAVRLKKTLASEQQMTEVGTRIAGSGTKAIFRDAERIAVQYGGDAADWTKMTSSTYTAPDGSRFATHWVENINTGRRIEFKTKFEY